MSRWRHRPGFGLLVVAAILMPADGDAQTAEELRRLSLEQLAGMEVTLVTRQPEAIGTSAAAVSVVTRDDIRRSGVTTLADAMGLADGVHVARFNNGSWSVSARGFNGSTPNKLLVMVDGRNEITPLFTGVFWNMLDYVLDDVERIEVIRGPAAALWGANAVNAVINIVTRNARDTRGTLLSVGVGNEDPALVEARYGAGSDALSYRIYGKFVQRDAQHFSTGISAEDDRRRGQIGMRVDGKRGSTSWLMKADVFHSRDGFIDRRDGEWTGIGVQARINRELPIGGQFQLHSYYRREYRNIQRQLTHHLDTMDVDFQHTFELGTRHDVIWGAAYRRNQDVTAGSEVIHFDPPGRTYPVFSAFAQDEFALRPNAVFLIAGLKVEHNAFSGVDVQPNVRVRFLPTRHQTVWMSVARAVRRPTRFDDDIVITAPNGTVLVRGNDDFKSETMTGWEVGYRVQPAAIVALSATVFNQDYDRLRSQEQPLVGLVPITLANTLDGNSRGIELSADLQPRDRWRVHASYSYLRTEISRAAGSRDVSGGVNEANDPRHLVMIRGSWDAPGNLEADLWLRHVGKLPSPEVPGYAELNARLAWQPRKAWQVSLVGQDLFHAQHPEFGTAVPRRVEFERSVRVVVTLNLPE